MINHLKKFKFLVKFLLFSFLLYLGWRYVGVYYYAGLRIAAGGVLSLFPGAGKLISAGNVLAGGEEIIYQYQNGNIIRPLNLEVISLSLILYLSLTLAALDLQDISKHYIKKLITGLLTIVLFHVLLIVANYTYTSVELIINLLNFLNSLLLPLLLWLWSMDIKLLEKP